MANTFFGTWSVSSGAYPSVSSDADYAQFYVLDGGTFGGTSYAAGDWLVYIKESSASHWFRTDGGSIAFNVSENINIPEAGFYTKVRLDNNGNIIAAESLDKTDLPEHTHAAESITGLDSPVRAIIGAMAVSDALAPASLSYDKKSKTLSVSLNLDESSIIQDENGCLCVNPDLISEYLSKDAKTSDHTHTASQITDFSDSVKSAVGEMASSPANSPAGLDFDSKTKTLSVQINIDGSSITQDANGCLCVNPDILSDYLSGSSSSGVCGNHTHTASQITDFSDAVKKVVKSAGLNQITASDVPIDESTIIINSSGKLQAVAAAIQKHTHDISDITGFDHMLLSWAALQTVQAASGDASKYNDGKHSWSSATIEEVIETINKDLAATDTAISSLKGKVGRAEPAIPNDIDYSGLYASADFIDVHDILSGQTVKAARSVSLRTKSGFYLSDTNAERGSLAVYLDGKLRETIDLSSIDGVGLYGGLSVVSVEDAYKGQPTFTGWYNAVSVSYELAGLDEGSHSAYMLHTSAAGAFQSDTVSFNIYKETSPAIASLALKAENGGTGFVSGIQCVSAPAEFTATAEITDFTGGAYCPVTLAKAVINGEILSPESASYTSLKAVLVFKGTAVTEQKTLIPSASVSAYKYDLAESDKAAKVLAAVTIDGSSEKYRVKKLSYAGSMIPAAEGSTGTAAWNPSESLVSMPAEMQVRAGSAWFDGADYTEYGGSDYSALAGETYNGTEYKFITLRFECPFIANLYIDLHTASGSAFARSKNGTLSGALLYASLSPDDSPSLWADGNKPYAGTGHIEDNSYGGLDLYRSSAVRRYITFGRLPNNLSKGYLFIRIGISSGSVSIDDAVSSVLECIESRK